MDVLTAVVVSRAAERIAVVLVGGLCIGLGWALFAKRLPSDSEATATYKGFRVMLRRVGPGVLFAGFGAVIVTTSFVRPVTFQVSERNPRVISAPAPEEIGVVAPIMGREVRYSGVMNDRTVEQRLQAAAALNLAIRLTALKRTDADVLSATLDDLKRRVIVLEKLRDELATSELGTETVGLWKLKGSQFLKNERSVSRSERENLSRAKPWFDPEEVR